jgi:subtilase family serine protease
VIAQVEAAFQVSINNYQLGANLFLCEHQYACHSAVASISGLDNSVHMHPLYRHASSGRGNSQPALSDKPRSTLTQPHAEIGEGYGPSDLNSAYDATPLLNAGIQGDNQTVAIFELDGYPSSDVTQYFQAYNLGNSSISNVLVDGFNGFAGDGAIEVDLDIEVVAAMASKAAQLVYEGPNSTQGFKDTFN